MKVIGWLLALVLVGIPLSIWQGYVLSVLWSWFIVPTFNAVYLDVVPAMGIALMVGLFSNRVSKDADDDRVDRAIQVSVQGMLSPAIALLFGWLYKQFM